MVNITSMKIKIPVLLVLSALIIWAMVALPVSNGKALAVIGLILLAESYILGIDVTIVKRIIKMKPLNRTVNGMYYLVVGIIVLVMMALGEYAFYQWAFGVFLVILGVSILIYQLRKGSKLVLSVRSGEEKGAAASSDLKKGADLTTATASSRGLKSAIREYKIHVYLMSLGSDLAVTSLFFAIFALTSPVTAILLFILGYIIRFVGDFMAKKAGVVKEQAVPEEVPWG
nr:hypothetical protein [Candidatus Njordarchaeota archaeon]